MSDHGQGTGSLVPTRLQLIQTLTDSVVSRLTADECRDSSSVEASLVHEANAAIQLANTKLERGMKMRAVTDLLPVQIAQAMAKAYPIVRIAGAGMSVDEDQDILALYREDGPHRGTYVMSEIEFRKIIRKYKYSITSKEVDETMAALQELVPRVVPCRQPNLIAVNNGIFDYDMKQLLPFSSEYVFLSKSRVNYNPNAKNVVIHNDEDGTDWDVESWMNTLSDDPEVVDLLWQLLGATIRPHVSWNKSAWFYSESGNNGKGTLCELMRQLCGEGSYASISLSDMSKDFMLESLTRATAIIVDENDVGTYIDKAANLKAIITGDTILINRKYKTAIPYQFHGFMVQCLNEMPRIRDKSDSFFRRQLFIPFTKCFTGKERKYIKDDYLHRQDVLEYVLYRVLNMNYYNLSTPKVCEQALNEYKEFVDPVRAFAKDIFPKLVWDFVPYKFLYDLFVAWYAENNRTERYASSLRRFLKDLRNVLPELQLGWEDAAQPQRMGSYLTSPEPLIREYNLTKWMDMRFQGNPDPYLVCKPRILNNDLSRGFLRIGAAVKGDDDEETT